MGGSHEASRLAAVEAEDHRAMYADLLGRFRMVVAPSLDAADYYRRAFPDLHISGIYHPERPAHPKLAPRAGSSTDILLLGAIGPHKGSRQLLDLARHARIVRPELTFHVVGFTDIDAELVKVGNVVVTGEYKAAELEELIQATGGCLALFLHVWPETYSYTLSEAVALGLVPLVPDLGAPAERVRAAGFGHVFPFPIRADQVLALLDSIASGEVPPWTDQDGPKKLLALSSTEAELTACLTDPRPRDRRSDKEAGYRNAS